MPDFNMFMSSTNPLSKWYADIEGDNRSQNLAERLINDKPSSIVIVRGATSLSAQTVRIETTRIEPYETVGDAGRGNKANILILGYKGHPTQPDFDVKAGDNFVFDGIRYRIRQVYNQNAGFVEAWGDIWA